MTGVPVRHPFPFHAPPLAAATMEALHESDR